MEQSETNMIAKKVFWYEATAFLFIIVVRWLDEILDIPYVLLGAPATPINWRESLFESVIILIIGAVIIRHTYKLLMRVSYLESVLPTCESCGRIRVDSQFWQGVDEFIAARSKNGVGHSLCPNCIHRYYPELERRKEDSAGAE
ncbi:MAG: hypothetical protein RBS95_00885 [Desulfobulbus sp.]|jgi:hypothetical protein|nr:hypothetical protein [Desulfobulbus sp.]